MSKVNEKSEKKLSSNRFGIEYFKYILMTLFGFLFFYPPYLRGLYFEDEQFPAQIISFLLIIGVMIYKAIKYDKTFLKTPLDYGFFGMTIVYILSLFVAVNLRSAISEFLKYSFYFGCFYITSQLFTQYKHKLILLWVSILSVFGVCVISLDAAIGPIARDSAGRELNCGPLSVLLNNFLEWLPLLHLKRSFFDIFLYGKIYSTYQYSNAFASVALAIFVICVTLLSNSKKLVSRGILGALAYVVFTSMLITQSRGVTLLIPFVLILLVVAVGKGVRAKTGIYVIIPVILAGITYFRGYEYIINATGHELKAWMIFLSGSLVAAGITLAAGFAMQYLEKYWIICACALGVIVLCGALLSIVAFTKTEPLKFEITNLNDNKPQYVQKAFALESGVEYKLTYEIEGTQAAQEEYNYYVKIFNKNIKDILSDKSQEIFLKEGQASRERKKIDVEFKVPQDSKSVLVEFGNRYPNKTCTFYSAQISRKDSPANINTINLKYKYLPESIVSKFENMNAAKSVIERSIFNKDGFEVYKERWLMGAGGGAWSYLYNSKQSYYYTTTQAHNFILQLAIETGIIGLLVFAFLIISAKVMFMTEYVLIRKGENEESERTLQGGLITACAGMLIHSLLDFDFSLSAVFLLFCVLMGLFNNRYSSITMGDIKMFKYSPINKLLDLFRKITFNFPKFQVWNGLLITVFALLIILPLTLYNGLNFAEMGNSYMKNDPQKSIEFFRDATGSDPFKAEYRNLFANAIIKAKSMNKIELKNKDISDVEEYLGVAYEKSRYSTKDCYETGLNYFSIGDTDKALEMYKTSALLSPRLEVNWGQYIGAHLSAAYMYSEEKKTKEALSIAQKALEIPKTIMEYNKTNLLPFKFQDDTMQNLEMLEFLKNNPDKNNGYQSVAFYSFKDMIDADLNNVPDQWEEESAKVLKLSYNNGLVVKNDTGNVVMLNTRKLEIEEEKKYYLEISLEKNNQIKKKMDSFVCSLDGINGSFNAVLDNGSYKAVIDVPKDYKNTSPLLRIQMPVGESAIDRISLLRIAAEDKQDSSISGGVLFPH